MNSDSAGYIEDDYYAPGAEGRANMTPEEIAEQEKTKQAMAAAVQKEEQRDQPETDQEVFELAEQLANVKPHDPKRKPLVGNMADPDYAIKNAPVLQPVRPPDPPVKRKRESKDEPPGKQRKTTIEIMAESHRKERDYLQMHIRELQKQNYESKARFAGSTYKSHREVPGLMDTDPEPSSEDSLRRTHSFRDLTPKKLTDQDMQEREKQLKGDALGEYKRVELGTPQQTQIKQTEQIVENQTNSLNQQMLILGILDKQQKGEVLSAQDAHDVKQMLQAAKENLLKEAHKLDQSNTELKQSKQIATYYTHTLEMPSLYEYTDYNVPGTNEKLQARNIRAAIEPFHPEKNPKSDFADTWRAIMMYTKNMRLDEDSYIMLLTILVQGSPSKILYEMTQAQKPITTILKTLGDLYSPRRTIVDDMQELNNFKRLPNEGIHVTMQRVTGMADRVRHLWPPTIWETTKKTEILLSILRQVITHQTKKHLEYEEMKYWKTGTTLEYEAMLDLVETFENSNDQKPTTEKGLTINVCTNTPRTSKIEKEKKPPKSKKEDNGTQRQLELISQNLMNVTQTIRNMAIEPMETGKSYKPTISWPPKETQLEAFSKKRKLDAEGTYQPIKQDQLPPRADKPKMLHKAHKPPPQHKPAPQQLPQPQPHPQPQQRQPNLITPPQQIPIDTKPQEWVQTQPRGGYNGGQQRGGYSNRGQSNYGYRGAFRYDTGNYRGNRNSTYRGGRGNFYNYRQPQDRYRNSHRYYNNPTDYHRQYWDEKRYQRRQETEEEKRERLKIYYCPSCKKQHKITNFCPQTGAMVVDEQQLALNWEDSHRSLLMRVKLDPK